MDEEDGLGQLLVIVYFVASLVADLSQVLYDGPGQFLVLDLLEEVQLVYK